MSAMPLRTQKPLTRTESFQRMLDLEKRCKLARLHSTQTSTATDTSLNLQSRVQSHSSVNPVLLSPRLGKATMPLRKIDALSPLSLAIPRPSIREGGACAHSKQEEEAHATEAALDEQLNSSKLPDKAITQERIEGEFDDNASQYHEDDDRSDQSSICQSPSWEGYDQKKKMKKKQQEADHQRRESDRIVQTRKATANKRSSNRLFKAQPGESANHTKTRKRSSGASASESAESSNTLTEKLGTLKLHPRQTRDLDIRGIGESDTSPGQMSTAGLVDNKLPSTQVTDSAEPAQQSDQTLKVTRLSSDGTEGKDDAIPLGNEKMSYPPPSSRSHTLRNVVLPSHYRRNSASAVSSQTTNSFHTKSNQPSQVHLDGNLLVSSAAEAAPRGRPSTSNRETDSYVHRVRTQSVERSIKGFMLEAALSNHGLATQNDNASILYLNQLRQQPPLSVYQRHSPTQSAHALDLPLSDGMEGSNSLVSNATKKSSSQLDKAIQQPREERQEEQEQAGQELMDDMRTPHDAEQSAASTKSGPPTKDCNVGPKSNSTPNLDTATPVAGIFSSIKTRISRRGSTSGGPYFTSAGRSFKERAMGAMHLPSHSAMAPAGKPSTGKPSENASQASIESTMSGIWSNAAERSLPNLPKPARLLGELNAETMSQGKVRGGSRPSEGSSASSYHEGSSAPVSPASTPDTSRPQSIKGFSVGVGTQREDPGVSIPRQKVATIPPETRLVQDAPSTSKIDNATRGKTEMMQPKTSGSQQPNAEGSSAAANGAIGSPSDKTKSSGEGPDSHDRTSQDSGLATTPMRDEKASGEPRSHFTDSTAFGSVPSGNLSMGLGILNGTFALPTATPSAVGGSFNTIAETSNPGFSAGPQPEIALATTVKASSRSMEQNKGVNSCAEPEQASQKPAAALSISAAAAAAATATTASSTSTGTNSGPYAPPKGATGPKSATNTTRPMNHAAHGRGHSAGAIYLQEVRRSAPMISSPLSTVIRNTAKLSSQRVGGSMGNSTPSLCAAERILPSPSPTLSQFRLPEPAFGPRQPELVRGSSVSIGSSSVSSSSISVSSGSGGRKRAPVLPVPQPNPPLAKMLVECCRCKYFHDMPSRVYECMAQPNAAVTDCNLGVSGAITTMVKCPWCSHNMRTQCCAGYAAVVYLRERLH